jgi:uncharacterized protein
MEDEYPIEESPLNRTVTRDGMSVEIQIYRGGDEKGWTLEVVDHEFASTVWDDLFATDQAALEEAMRTIEEDGISSFLRPPDSELH